jgi:hypothetical protein
VVAALAIHCSSFQSTEVLAPDAGGEGGAAEGGTTPPDAAADAAPLTVRCEGNPCSLDTQVCCLVFGGTDHCIPRPPSVLGPCPGGGATPTFMAECDDTSECPSPSVCCVVPSAGYYALRCQPACDAPATPTCNPSRDKCAKGDCTALPGSNVYFACQ